MLIAEQIFVTHESEGELRELCELFAVAKSSPMATGIVNYYQFDDFSYIKIDRDWSGKMCVECYVPANFTRKLQGRYYLN